MQDVRNIITATDVNHKIKHTLRTYLTKQDRDAHLAFPDYEPDGYELAYINSDRQDYLYDPEAVPDLINDIRKRYSVRPRAPRADALKGSMAEQVAKVCGYPITE